MATFTGTKILKSEGVFGGNPTQSSRDKALVHGIRLSALAGNIWPHSDDGLSKLVASELLTETMAFAIHARRYMELSQNKELLIDGPLFQIKLPGYRYETRLWTALNRIVHGEELLVHSVEADTIKHTNLGDRVIAAITIQSQQRDKIAVCPQGMVYGFAQSRLAAQPNY